MHWFCRGELAQTMGSHWKYCPFCCSPLTDYAASIQQLIKAADQMAEAIQDGMLKLAPYLQKVYEAAKEQGLLNDSDTERDDEK